jgi:hypothetical protein
MTRSLVARKDGRRLRRLTLYLTPATARELDVYCVMVEEERSKTVERAVVEFLRAHSPSPAQASTTTNATKSAASATEVSTAQPRRR